MQLLLAEYEEHYAVSGVEQGIGTEWPVYKASTLLLYNLSAPVLTSLNITGSQSPIMSSLPQHVTSRNQKTLSSPYSSLLPHPLLLRCNGPCASLPEDDSLPEGTESDQATLFSSICATQLFGLSLLPFPPGETCTQFSAAGARLGPEVVSPLCEEQGTWLISLIGRKPEKSSLARQPPYRNDPRGESTC